MQLQPRQKCMFVISLSLISFLMENLQYSKCFSSWYVPSEMKSSSSPFLPAKRKKERKRISDDVGSTKKKNLYFQPHIQRRLSRGNPALFEVEFSIAFQSVLASSSMLMQFSNDFRVFSICQNTDKVKLNPKS